MLGPLSPPNRTPGYVTVIFNIYETKCCQVNAWNEKLLMGTLQAISNVPKQHGHNKTVYVNVFFMSIKSSTVLYNIPREWILIFKNTNTSHLCNFNWLINKDKVFNPLLLI